MVGKPKNILQTKGLPAFLPNIYCKYGFYFRSSAMTSIIFFKLQRLMHLHSANNKHQSDQDAPFRFNLNANSETQI